MIFAMTTLSPVARALLEIFDIWRKRKSSKMGGMESRVLALLTVESREPTVESEVAKP